MKCFNNIDIYVLYLHYKNLLYNILIITKCFNYSAINNRRYYDIMY